MSLSGWCPLPQWSQTPLTPPWRWHRQPSWSVCRSTCPPCSRRHQRCQPSHLWSRRWTSVWCQPQLWRTPWRVSWHPQAPSWGRWICLDQTARLPQQQPRVSSLLPWHTPFSPGWQHSCHLQESLLPDPTATKYPADVFVSGQINTLMLTLDCLGVAMVVFSQWQTSYWMTRKSIS